MDDPRTKAPGPDDTIAIAPYPVRVNGRAGTDSTKVLTSDRREPRLSRAFLKAGDLGAVFAQDAPALHVLSDAERAASLREAMADRPDGDLWIFAYGSLIWNPTVQVVERRVARIDGWRRSFCLSSVAGRGSPLAPGVVLGLEAGGACDGVALRLSEDGIENELELLWRREMATGAYTPRWVDLYDEAGQCFATGLTFTVDPDNERYAGRLPRELIVHRLATAAGGLGTAADYLFRTRDALRDTGISDPELERLAISVARTQALALAAE